jgi:hypothetical protein
MAANLAHGRILRPAFGGHETFPFRYTWMPKAVQHVADDAFFFQREDAMVRLGVGKNMVRSIRHWALACGVLEEDTKLNARGQALRISAFGQQVFGPKGWDPYLEDPATIWLLHWNVARTPEHATAWYWIFNHMPQPEFSRSDLVGWLRKLAQDENWVKAEASVKRDVDCLVRSYVSTPATKKVSLEDTLDCPLAELGLVREFGGRSSFLLVRSERSSLSDEVFAYTVIEFLRSVRTEAKTASVNTLAFQPGSPGRVLCLNEDAVLARLERLERLTGGALSFDETAGLRQVLIRRLPEATAMLARHYERQNEPAAAGGRR